MPLSLAATYALEASISTTTSNISMSITRLEKEEFIIGTASNDLLHTVQMYSLPSLTSLLTSRNICSNGNQMASFQMVSMLSSFKLCMNSRIYTPPPKPKFTNLSEDTSMAIIISILKRRYMQVSIPCLCSRGLTQITLVDVHGGTLRVPQQGCGYVH